jgi:hypothetical protein
MNVFRHGWFKFRLTFCFGRRRVRLKLASTTPLWLVAFFSGMLAGYFFGAIPTLILLEKAGLGTTMVEVIAGVVYAPLTWLAQHVEWFNDFFTSQEHFWRRIL